MHLEMLIVNTLKNTIEIRIRIGRKKKKEIKNIKL